MKNIFSFGYAMGMAVICVFFLASCSDSSGDSLPDPSHSGKLRIEFDNVAGDKNLVLNSVIYRNAVGEDFVATKFNYFISNIRLFRTDGTTYTVPQDSSYFLIKEDTKASQFVTLNAGSAFAGGCAQTVRWSRYPRKNRRCQQH